MVRLQEMNSDTFAGYLRSFDSPRKLVSKHRRELEEVAVKIQKHAMKNPVPPDIIITCSDGEKMSIPVHWSELVH